MKLRPSLLVTALTACSALSASAATIDLGINGDVQVSSSAISFGQYPNGAPYAPAPGYGTFQVSIVNSGIFGSNGVTTGEFGTIQSLSNSTAAVSPTPGSSLPFMTFDSGGSNLQLYLTELLPGSSSGPYTVTDLPDGAILAFNVDGYVYNTSTLARTNFTATFSATFDGMTAAELLGGIDPNTPFTGTFMATLVPEPSSLLLLGLGAAALGLGPRRTRT